MPPKDLTELDRVNFVVNAIENDCQISPVGAFKMTSAHQVRRNEAFKGLSCEASVCLSSYCHFRNVQCGERKKFLDEPSAPFDAYFLDPIQYDQPKGCWNF